MERVQLIRNQINCISNKLKNNSTSIKTKYTTSSYDYLNFDQFLTIEEREYRKRLRAYLEKEVKSQIVEFVESTNFPYEIVKNLVKEFPGIVAPTMAEYEGLGLPYNLSVAICMELARIDMSLTAFITVQGEVVMKAIQLLGSEEQKKYFLPKLNKLELYGAFCLTEPNHGSNAYGIETSAKEDSSGNIIINGTKRWIGQGTMADVYIVWARHENTGDIQGYIVEKSRKGLSSKKIEGKLAFRAVQSGEVNFDNVTIPKSNKLEKANNFAGISDVFLGSRLGIGFAAAGLCMGAYDTVIEYISKRNQFGKPLSSFQLIQEKLARIMGNIQAMIFFSKRIGELHLQGKATMGMAGLCKAWCTSRARETLAMAREILGGNGILNENYVMRAMCDVEGLYTAEGTYEMNMLLTGKELTGKLAII